MSIFYFYLFLFLNIVVKKRYITIVKNEKN